MYLRTLKYEPSDTVALLIGRTVHGAIERYENAGLKDDVLQQAAIDINNALVENPPIFTAWDSVAKIHNSVNVMLNNYFRYKEGAVLESEKAFEIELVSTDGVPYLVIGRIDQIVDYGDTIGIVDIKTSRKPPTVYEIMGDYQFTMYAMAFYHEYGYLPDYIHNFYLPEGEYIEYKRTNKDIVEFKQLLDQTVFELTEIKDNWEEYHKSKGYHCNYCKYAIACYGL